MLQDPLDVETFNSQELMVYLNESRCLSLETEDPTDDENPPEGRSHSNCVPLCRGLCVTEL